MFVIFQISLQRNGDTRTCACYKVFGVNKLNNSWNLYKKNFTRPKSNPTNNWKYGRAYFVMIGNTIYVENACLALSHLQNI